MREFLVHYTTEDGRLMFEWFRGMEESGGEYLVNSNLVEREEFYRLYGAVRVAADPYTLCSTGFRYNRKEQ